MKSELPTTELKVPKPSSVRLLIQVFLMLVIILLVLLLLVIFVEPFLLQLPIHLIFGWALYLWRTIPEVSVNASMISSGLVMLGLAMVSLHFMALWLCGQMTQVFWTWRSTLSLTLIVLVLFGSAMCGTGIVHQIGWLRQVQWTGDLFAPPSGGVMHAARELRIAVFIYAQDNQGNLPENLLHIKDVMEDDPAKKLILKTQPSNMTSEVWTYLGAGLRLDDPHWLPLLVQPRPLPSSQEALTKRGRVVALMDGSIETLSEQDYAALMSRWRGFVRGRQP